jgi:lia operon protein LiaG
MKRIVILLLIITGLYIIFNQSFHFGGFAFAGSKDESAAVSNRTDTIKIEVGAVRTIVIPEDRDDVRAVLTGKGNVIVKEAGEAVEVKTKNRLFNWFSFSGKRELKIYIPADYTKDMEMNIGSGSLNFSGEAMKLDTLTVDIGSGDVKLTNIEVNEFNHDVSSGDVKIDTLKTKVGHIDLSSGNLEIDHYTGALEADVSSGEFSVQMDQLKDEIDLDVSSGEANLDLPDDADFELDADVSSGDIKSDFPLTSKGTDKKGLNGTHGSGKYKVDVSVSSGNVHIY